MCSGRQANFKANPTLYLLRCSPSKLSDIALQFTDGDLLGVQDLALLLNVLP